MKLPNGLVRGRDGLIYVPSTLTGIIDVFSITEKRLLEKITSIHVGLPIDNLSIDKNGDIYAAAFPQVYKWTHSSKDPSINPPSAVFRVRKAGKGYQGDSRKGSMERYEGDYIIEKVVEDDGSLLPGSTTVVHDAQTGRLFLAGVMSPFIVICQKG
jgi:arylesterase/paraoxonase